MVVRCSATIDLMPLSKTFSRFAGVSATHELGAPARAQNKKNAVAACFTVDLLCRAHLRTPRASVPQKSLERNVALVALRRYTIRYRLVCSDMQTSEIFVCISLAALRLTFPAEMRLDHLETKTSDSFPFRSFRCADIKSDIGLFARKCKRAKRLFAFRSLHCADKPGSVLPASRRGYHISGITVASYLKRLSHLNTWQRRARPCTQVGILPFHPMRLRTDSSRRMPLPLGSGVSARIPVLRRWALPTTVLLLAECVPGLSSVSCDTAIAWRYQHCTT